MFKIKLLTLFLTSIFLICCSKKVDLKKQYNVKLVSGQNNFSYQNTLIQYLDSMKLYSSTNNNYLIQISPDLSQSVFITNIDKTSDRKKITLSITYNVFKILRSLNVECNVFSQRYKRSSTYLFASGEFNQSNVAADEEVTQNLISLITNDFIDDLLQSNKRERCTL